jgi:molybdopterin-guanine dinucleotide biosynthesis protein MobB
VAFIGYSGSGKTWLTERVIAELFKRGYNIGSIKHHSHSGFDIDHAGKDSFRHREAGSRDVVIAAPDQIARITQLNEELSPEEIISSMPGHNIIIVEGYKSSNLPRIVLDRAANDNKKREDIDLNGNVIAVVTDKAELANKAKGLNLPVFDYHDIERIADFLSDRIIA